MLGGLLTKEPTCAENGSIIVDIENSDMRVVREKRGRGGESGMSRRVGNRE